jgi:hypothetical protein
MRAQSRLYPVCMDTEFDRLLARLSEIDTELAGLADDDFPARYPLLSERDVLRDRLAELRESDDPDLSRSTEDLLREVTALEANIEALRDQKIDLVAQAGGGPYGSEMGNLGGVALNTQMSDATGLTALEQRAQRLRSILAERTEPRSDPGNPES